MASISCSSLDGLSVDPGRRPHRNHQIVHAVGVRRVRVDAAGRSRKGSDARRCNGGAGTRTGRPRFSGVRVVRVSPSHRRKLLHTAGIDPRFVEARNIAQVPCFSRRFGRWTAPRRPMVRECCLRTAYSFGRTRGGEVERADVSLALPGAMASPGRAKAPHCGALRSCAEEDSNLHPGIPTRPSTWCPAGSQSPIVP